MKVLTSEQDFSYIFVLAAYIISKKNNLKYKKFINDQALRSLTTDRPTNRSTDLQDMRVIGSYRPSRVFINKSIFEENTCEVLKCRLREPFRIWADEKADQSCFCIGYYQFTRYTLCFCQKMLEKLIK